MDEDRLNAMDDDEVQEETERLQAQLDDQERRTETTPRTFPRLEKLLKWVKLQKSVEYLQLLKDKNAPRKAIAEAEALLADLRKTIGEEEKEE